jgi:hypothetical protein
LASGLQPAKLGLDPGDAPPLAAALRDASCSLLLAPLPPPWPAAAPASPLVRAATPEGDAVAAYAAAASAARLAPAQRAARARRGGEERLAHKATLRREFEPRLLAAALAAAAPTPAAPPPLGAAGCPSSGGLLAGLPPADLSFSLEIRPAAP